ncbi:hypothetical protein [Pararhodonellum marinum]|uniref:hypothetical protein n=1 Tax=Pararhodonellum marinum TaxID=2755358 RepID=UPI00188EAA28|nr:hypothetical protein [Pararhodonellum marinum]
MKTKNLKLVSILFMMFLGFNAAQAQYQGQFRLQYAAEFTTVNNVLFGNNLTGEYFPLDKISFSPNFSIYTPATGKASMLHLDAKYYFTEENIQWYGLVGYGYFRRRFEFNPENPLLRVSSVNVGTGVIIRLIDELGLNPEFKFQPQNNGEFLIKIGLLYFIN